MNSFYGWVGVSGSIFWLSGGWVDIFCGLVMGEIVPLVGGDG